MKRKNSLAILNRRRILSAIEERPSTFTELLQRVDLSRPVLANHLRWLEGKEYAKREFQKGKIVYKLGGKAKKDALFKFLFLCLSYLRWTRGKTANITQDSKLVKTYGNAIAAITLYTIMKEIETKGKQTEAARQYISKIKSAIMSYIALPLSERPKNFEEASKWGVERLNLILNNPKAFQKRINALLKTLRKIYLKEIQKLERMRW